MACDAAWLAWEVERRAEGPYRCALRRASRCIAVAGANLNGRKLRLHHFATKALLALI
jgi:hypothetical protein